MKVGKYTSARSMYEMADDGQPLVVLKNIRHWKYGIATNDFGIGLWDRDGYKRDAQCIGAA